MAATVEERAIHKLVRTWSHNAKKVVDEFASEDSAKHAWRGQMREAGYRPRRNGEWHKPGHPVIMDPY